MFEDVETRLRQFIHPNRCMPVITAVDVISEKKDGKKYLLDEKKGPVIKERSLQHAYLHLY